jgi:hypothetical protein
MCLYRFQSSLLSSAQLTQLRLLFQRADKTAAGSLSAQQVGQLLRIACSESGGGPASKGLSDLALRDLLAEVDVSEAGSEGRCDFEQFCSLFSQAFEADGGAAEDMTSANVQSGLTGGAFLTPAELTELKSVFKSLDLDSDQFLSASDLQRAFAAIGDEYQLEEVEQMVKEVDSTRTGRIKLADFLAAMSPA